MNTASTIVPATSTAFICHISAKDPRMSYGYVDGQVVEYQHDRPEGVLAYIKGDDIGDRIARMVAEGKLTRKKAREFAALVSVPTVFPDDVDMWDYSTDLFDAEDRPILERFVALGKAQILELMRQGQIPNTVEHYGDLHDYCDANEFANLCNVVINDRMDKALRKPDDDTDCMSPALQDFSHKIQDILDQWLRLRLPNPHGETSQGISIATPFVVAFDGNENDEDEHHAGFTFGESWNGFACPYFTKEVAEKIAEGINVPDNGETITYDVAKDAFVETIHVGVNETETHDIKGQDILTPNGVVRVYAIGSFGWTWNVMDEVKS